MVSRCPIREIVKKGICCPKAGQRLVTKGVRGERLDETLCPWHIDCPECLDCFWVYIINTNKNKEHQLTEISKLFKTSINNIKLIETEALRKLSKELTHLRKS
jgi:hypothetical protein